MWDTPRSDDDMHLGWFTTPTVDYVGEDSNLSLFVFDNSSASTQVNTNRHQSNIIPAFLPSTTSARRGSAFDQVPLDVDKKMFRRAPQQQLQQQQQQQQKNKHICSHPPSSVNLSSLEIWDENCYEDCMPFATRQVLESFLLDDDDYHDDEILMAQSFVKQGNWNQGQVTFRVITMETFIYLLCPSLSLAYHHSYFSAHPRPCGVRQGQVCYPGKRKRVRKSKQCKQSLIK